MRQWLRDPRFALFELILVILCGAIWMGSPQIGGWFILIALSLFLLKVFTGNLRFIGLDWLILVFVTTAWIGYWAAYDQEIAWNKVWFIVLGILLFYSLREQPNENLIAVSVLLFSIGVSVCFYYFLTYDFIAAPRRLEFVNSIGRWFMSIRPQTNWTTIHPNYVAGITTITTPIIFHPISQNGNKKKNWFYAIAVVGLSVVFLALFMATSRGIILAIGSGVGAWLLWRLTQSDRIKPQLGGEAAFPILLMVYLCVVVAFLYVGPAQLGGVISNSNYYGTGSRAELFLRSLYLVSDYPITGGGLGAFPGLYSHYLLGIPFFYLPNSHNLFLDVAIEQGLLGGLSFFILYIISVWTVSGSISKDEEKQTFKWLVLFSLIVAVIHGMVDDYLYNSVGSILSLFLIGLVLNDERQKNILNSSRLNFKFVGVLITIGLVIGLIYLKLLQSIWYANLGSVQMTKLELDGFPSNGWIGNEIVPELDEAKKSLRSSLHIDPSNRTANQRLGMIAMYRRDFDAAVNYLEIAHNQAPNHRGVVKSLGYSYLWSGSAQNAKSLLAKIPEVEQELSVYVWWWDKQERVDLSEIASSALGNMNLATPNP